MWTPTHVQVAVHRASNLRRKGKADTNDAYVLVQLGSETHRTSVKERSKDPVWNEDYTFAVPPELRSYDVITLSVHHRNLLNLDDFLGKVEIPLYKLHMHDRPRVRRYALYDKHFSRSSFSRGSGNKRGSSPLESPGNLSSPEFIGNCRPGHSPVDPSRSMSISCVSESSEHNPVDSPGGMSTPTMHRLSSDPDMSHGEIEVTISFAVQPLTDKQQGILRPKKAVISEEEAQDRNVRRNSMPASAMTSTPKQADSTTKHKNRRSLMSLLDVPQAFASLRRNRHSVGDTSHLQPLSEGTENKAPTPAQRNFHLEVLPVHLNSPDEMKPTDSNTIKTTPDIVVSLAEHGSNQGPISDRVELDGFPDGREQSEEEEEMNNHNISDRNRNADLQPITFLTLNNRDLLDKYTPSPTEFGLFCGYDREDLILTVIRQHARLTLAEAYIGDLENYINTLLLRVLDSNPRLLQNPYVRQNNNPADSRTPNSVLKTVMGRR